MQLEKEECENASLVLTKVKEALKNEDTIELKELSNRTIHSSCSYQDPGSITTAVLIYTLSKLIERQNHRKMKNWSIFLKKFNGILDVTIKALHDNNTKAYERHMQKARKLLESVSGDLKPYIQDVLRKASINKGAKIYEHGISSERTSQLLGITQWELLEYAGYKNIPDNPFNETITVEKRAKIAMEFFA
jgi:hypothetical protein